MALAGSRAVFVDKDGTLVENVPFNVDPARVVLMPGAGEALAALHRAGFVIVVVSNQPGVGEGRFPASALAAVSRRLRDLLAPYSVPLLDCCYCPHARSLVPPCACRKPAPGLLLDAATRHHLDLSASWMIGDILDDVEAGHAAGCRAVLLDNGGETEWVLSPRRVPDATVRSLPEAAQRILAEPRHGPAGDGTLVAPSSDGGCQ